MKWDFASENRPTCTKGHHIPHFRVTLPSAVEWLQLRLQCLTAFGRNQVRLEKLTLYYTTGTRKYPRKPRGLAVLVIIREKLLDILFNHSLKVYILVSDWRPKLHSKTNSCGSGNEANADIDLSSTLERKKLVRSFIVNDDIRWQGKKPDLTWTKEFDLTGL
jgi:hypothetical protein